jgi:hypothetical protein
MTEELRPSGRAGDAGGYCSLLGEQELKPLAAAIKCAHELAGKKVVLYLSGGNISKEHLVRVLTDPNPF